MNLEPDQFIIGFIGGTAALGVNLFLFIGAFQNWKILVAPPEKWWAFYSLSRIKKFAEPDAVRPYLMLVGAGMICAGLFLLGLTFYKLYLVLLPIFK